MRTSCFFFSPEHVRNLDSKTGQAIIAIIKKLSGGKTVIIATHDERIIELAGRVITIEDGKMVEDVLQERWNLSDQITDY